MSEQKIVCPVCKTELEIGSALTQKIEADLKAHYEKTIADQRKRLTDAMTSIESREQALRDKEVAQDEAIALQVSAKVKQIRDDIVQQEREQAKRQQATVLAALQDELKAKDADISAMRNAEISLRKQTRELEQKAANLELDVQRRLDEERQKIKAEAVSLVRDEQQFKLREKDNLISQLTDQIESLRRKAESGSQEAQGEAVEQELQACLERSFPFDIFEEVKKGVRGGDIVQIVRNAAAKNCGRILWESKNTKAFSRQWLEKVKADQMIANANIAVIMSVTLPDEFVSKGERFGFIDGVWITDYKSSFGLTSALRYAIIEADKQRIVSQNQDSLKDLLFDYLTSKEAQLKVASVVDALNKMQADLDTEERAFTKLFASRRKQITTATANLAGFFGSIEGLVGQKALPEVQSGIAELESLV